MRQMTLRDIPDEIEMVARNKASRQGISLNKAFLTLLRRATHYSSKTIYLTGIKGMQGIKAPQKLSV